MKFRKIAALIFLYSTLSTAFADGSEELEAIQAKNKVCVAKLPYSQQLACFQRSDSAVQKILDANRTKLNNPRYSKFFTANKSILAACNGLATPGYKSAAVAIAECRYNNNFKSAWFLQF